MQLRGAHPTLRLGVENVEPANAAGGDARNSRQQRTTTNARASVTMERVGGATVSVGRLGESGIAELLAHAFNTQFTGALVLEPEGAEKSTVIFHEGLVRAAEVRPASSALARQALQQALPPDTIRFVELHARTLHLDLLGAVERLALLPPGALELVKRLHLELRVKSLVAFPESTLFGYFDRARQERSDAEGLPPLEPLGLIFTCLLAERDPALWRRQLEALRYSELRLVDARWVTRASFPPALAAAVQRLRARPYTCDEILRDGTAPDLELAALLYTLCMTRQALSPQERVPSASESSAPQRIPRRLSSRALNPRAAPVVGSSQRPPADHERPPPPHASPRASRSQSTESPQTVSSRSPSRPRRASLEPPQRSETELQRQWPERGAEARALQAWVDATGNPERLARSRAAVDRLANLFPSNPRIRYYCGCLRAMDADVAGALREFRAVLALDPHHPEAPVELERLLRRVGGSGEPEP